MLKRFYRNIILFLFPVCIIMAVVGRYWLVGYYTGELFDTQWVIERQRENGDILIGMGFNEQGQYLKLVNTNYYRADVIALGTSRVMQFKADYFTDSFYNAGGAVSGNYDEYVNFLENLEYTPRFIILGLDIWVFNDKWNSYACKTYSEFTPIQAISRSNAAIVGEIREAYENGKWSYGSLANFSHSYGMNGRIKGNGFIGDGSYVYGSTYRNPELQDDYQFKSTYDRIDNGRARFEYGDHIDEDTIEKLSHFLTYCDERDIYVIGFVGPMAPSVCNKMDKVGKYGYVTEIAPCCRQLFGEHEFEFYDYWNSENIGLTDNFFVDGFHGSDIAHGYIILDMISKGSKIAECIDEVKLMKLIEGRYSDLCFYNPYD